MATNRPNAVVTSASEIPADTDAMPPPEVAILEKALMMPTTVPKRPTNGAVAPMVARTARFSFNSATVIMAVQYMPWRAASTGISGSAYFLLGRAASNSSMLAEITLARLQSLVLLVT